MNIERPEAAIPPHAKLVYKGVIFEVWQWEQELFDGTTAIYERIRRPDSVEVIAVTRDGKIIVEEQEQPSHTHPFFSLPGGRADGGDDLLEEAKRELAEETAYVGTDWEHFETIRPFFDSDYRMHYFIARNVEQVGKPHLDSGEKISLRLLSFDEFMLFPEHPRFRGTEIAKILFQLRLHPERLESFRARLFKGIS